MGQSTVGDYDVRRSATGQLEVTMPHGHAEPEFDKNAKVSKWPGGDAKFPIPTAPWPARPREARQQAQQQAQQQALQHMR